MDNNDLTMQRLQDAFTRFYKAEWRQRPVRGLKRSEIRVLFCLMEGEKTGCQAKISDISKMLAVTTPTVTQLIKELNANGFVERTANPGDRRVAGLTLTEKGRQAAEEARDIFQCSLNGLIEHLGKEQSEQLAELLNKAYLYYNSLE